MSKRGLSEVVSTLILVLVVLFALALVWIVITNVLEEGSEEVNLGKVTLDLNIVSASASDDATISISVERKVGSGEFNGLVFLFTNGTDSERIETDYVLEELEKETFEIVLENLNASQVIEVSTAVIFSNGEGGDILDTYILTGEEEPEEIPCVPETCISLGKECGDWSDGCSGMLDCGICSEGVCNASGQCALPSGAEEVLDPIADGDVLQWTTTGINHWDQIFNDTQRQPIGDPGIATYIRGTSGSRDEIKIGAGTLTTISQADIWVYADKTFGTVGCDVDISFDGGDTYTGVPMGFDDFVSLGWYNVSFIGLDESDSSAIELRFATTTIGSINIYETYVIIKE